MWSPELDLTAIKLHSTVLITNWPIAFSIMLLNSVMLTQETETKYSVNKAMLLLKVS